MDQPINVPSTSPSAPTGAIPPHKPDDLTYNVMPQEGKTFSVNFDDSKNSSSAKPAAPKGSNSSSSRQWIYIIVGIIVLLALGGVAYYLLGTKKTTTVQAPATQLPKTWLTQYFNTDTCTDQTTCGDNADPDNDGLSNYGEFKAGTNPLNPDTDGDGLADGDEVNIYKTDPTLKYTDRREVVAANDWSDGFQIKGGFDPLTPGLKFTDVRTQQIATDTATFHLHEPSITTTTSAAPSSADQATSPDNKSSTTTAQTVNVDIYTMVFSPNPLTIKKGDTVVWTNKDPVAHTVTSDTNLFSSPSLATSQSFKFTFPNAGTFSYHCSIHPNMKAMIIVQ